MENEKIKPWCAVAQYPDKKKLWCGTITMPANAQYHEIEAAMRNHMLQFLPNGFEITDLVCGALFFQPAEE